MSRSYNQQHPNVPKRITKKQSIRRNRQQKRLIKAGIIVDRTVIDEKMPRFDKRLSDIRFYD